MTEDYPEAWSNDNDEYKIGKADGSSSSCHMHRMENCHQSVGRDTDKPSSEFLLIALWMNMG